MRRLDHVSRTLDSMTNAYLLIKTVHIITATILFGTGLGIAFFMFRSRFTDRLQEKFYAVRTTVLADGIFIAPAAVLQPASGAWLIWHGGLPWTDRWLLATYVLYAIAAVCWLPVVWIQIRLKQIVATCLVSGDPLPDRYHRLSSIWFILGLPAFTGLVAVFFLMVLKPS
jgi:uncharacterized membrane protein